MSQCESLAVNISGRGIPLVWGHGLLCSMQFDDEVGFFDWDEISKGCKLIRYDARCHGNSPCSQDPLECQWNLMGDDMLHLARQRGGSQCILGGMSMGAAAALHAAVTAPQQVKGLILAIPPTAWETRPRQARIYRTMVRFNRIARNWPYRLAALLAPKNAKGRTRFASLLMDHIAASSIKAVNTALSGAANSDLPPKEAIAQLDMPVLILSWKGDVTHPVSTAKELAKLLPNVTSLEIGESFAEVDWERSIVDFVQSIK